MRRSIIVSCFLFALLGFAASRPANAQSAAGFSLEVAASGIARDDLSDPRLALGLRPRWCPSGNPRFCFLLDVCRILQPGKDPWRRLPFPNVRGEELKIGPSWLVAPTVELGLGSPEATIRPALYLGAGLNRAEGRDTNLGERGQFNIATSTSPMVTYGVNLAFDLSDRSTLRFQLGAATTFQDDVRVTRNGVARTAQGDTVTAGVFGVSLGFALGGGR